MQTLKEKKMNERLWEINHHWSKVGDEDSIFSGCSVSPIFILEESIAPGASVPSILAKDADGNKFRGSRKNYFETEELAWKEIKRDLSESLLHYQSEVTLLQAQCEAIEKFLNEKCKP